MKQEKISKEMQLNIILKNVEKLQKSVEVLNHVIPEMDTRIKQIKSSEINIKKADFQELDNKIGQIKKHAERRVNMPTWIVVVMLVMIVITGLSGFMALQFMDIADTKKAEYDKMKETATFWHETAIEHGYVKPEN